MWGVVVWAISDYMVLRALKVSRHLVSKHLVSCLPTRQPPSEAPSSLAPSFLLAIESMTEDTRSQLAQDTSLVIDREILEDRKDTPTSWITDDTESVASKNTCHHARYILHDKAEHPTTDTTQDGPKVVHLCGGIVLCYAFFTSKHLPTAHVLSLAASAGGPHATLTCYRCHCYFP